MDRILKTKSGFILKNIAGDYIVVPGGKNIVDFRIMLTLNETGAWIWKELEKGVSLQELTESFAENNGIEISVAENDVKDFILQLENRELLEG